jgi:hypothetical protein
MRTAPEMREACSSREMRELQGGPETRERRERGEMLEGWERR